MQARKPVQDPSLVALFAVGEELEHSCLTLGSHSSNGNTPVQMNLEMVLSAEAAFLRLMRAEL